MAHCGGVHEEKWVNADLRVCAHVNQFANLYLHWSIVVMPFRKVADVASSSGKVIAAMAMHASISPRTRKSRRVKCRQTGRAFATNAMTEVDSGNFVHDLDVRLDTWCRKWRTFFAARYLWIAIIWNKIRYLRAIILITHLTCYISNFISFSYLNLRFVV